MEEEIRRREERDAAEQLAKAEELDAKMKALMSKQSLSGIARALTEHFVECVREFSQGTNACSPNCANHNNTFINNLFATNADRILNDYDAGQSPKPMQSTPRAAPPPLPPRTVNPPPARTHVQAAVDSAPDEPEPLMFPEVPQTIPARATGAKPGEILRYPISKQLRLLTAVWQFALYINVCVVVRTRSLSYAP
jgi:hypothetical protein